MKKLADGVDVTDAGYYFLLDWNDVDQRKFINAKFDKNRLCDLNISEYFTLFNHVACDTLDVLRNIRSATYHKESLSKDFELYQRTQKSEMRPVTESDIECFKADDSIPASFQFNVSISDIDRKNGSPKIGDMIARNPENHMDKWLVAEKYFEANFERLSKEI